jgi:mannan endo-1,6-alpha-mannosidase
MFQVPVLFTDCHHSDFSPTDHFSKAAVKSSAEIIAQNVLTYYPLDSTSPSGQAIGIFGPDYTWGEAGAVWGGLVNYWALTGDSQFNGQVQAALAAQSGLPSSALFLPGNQTSTEVHG